MALTTAVAGPQTTSAAANATRPCPMPASPLANRGTTVRAPISATRDSRTAIAAAELSQASARLGAAAESRRLIAAKPAAVPAKNAASTACAAIASLPTMAPRARTHPTSATRVAAPIAAKTQAGARPPFGGTSSGMETACYGIEGTSNAPRPRSGISTQSGRLSSS